MPETWLSCGDWTFVGLFCRIWGLSGVLKMLNLGIAAFITMFGGLVVFFSPGF